MSMEETSAKLKLVRRSQRNLWSDLLLTLPFIGFFLVQIVHHDMWRDELNAFGIAVASPTLSSLFHYIHYEGHPWLWYVMLWIVSKFTVFPVGMKVLEAVIGIAIYLVLGLGSPFSRGEKILLFLCYFISFEYTVMSRMYGILLLLLLLYLRHRNLYPERFVRNALLLGLIASTDMMGVLLSISLFIEYGFFLFYMPNKAPKIERSRLVQGASVYLIVTGLAVWSAKTASDIGHSATGYLFQNATSLEHLLDSAERYIALPYFPIRNPLKPFFWNPHPESYLPVFCVISILILVAYSRIFRRNQNLLLLMSSIILATVAFGHLIYLGSMRHHGITFLAFLAGIWILKSEQSRLPRMAYVLLGLTALGGVLAGVQTWQRPFSNANAAAAWLKTNHLDVEPLAGTPDTVAVAVAELLHKPIYMLDCNCTDTFVLYSDRRDSFSIGQIPDRLALARSSLHVASFIYLGNSPFSAQQESAVKVRGMEVMPLATFTGAENEDENYYIYRVSDVAQSAAYHVQHTQN